MKISRNIGSSAKAAGFLRALANAIEKGGKDVQVDMFLEEVPMFMTGGCIEGHHACVVLMPNSGSDPNQWFTEEVARDAQANGIRMPVYPTFNRTTRKID